MIYIDDKIDALDFDAALANVSPQRRDHALRYRQERDRRLSVAVYRLLQKALAVEYGITEAPLFEFNEHGKPRIVGHPEIYFNLSHCREAAACVVSPVPVGIDIEDQNRYDAELVKAVMNDEEQRQIACSSDPALAFTRLWTMKESLLKMTGEGLSKNLCDILAAPQVVAKAPYRFHTTIHPSFVCTACYSEE